MTLADRLRFLLPMGAFGPPGEAAGGASGETPTPEPKVPATPTPGEVEPKVEVPPAAEPPKAEGEGGEAAAPKTELPSKISDPAQARINRLTAQKARLQEEVDRLRAAQVAPQGEASLGEAEVERRAEAKATAKAAQAAFDAECDVAAKQGKVSYSDWDAKINELVGYFDRTNPEEVRQYVSIVQAALATGAAHEVMYTLANNPEEALRLAGLDPVRLGVAVAKIVQPKVEDPGPSRAPKPLTPLGQRSTSHTSVDPRDPERADRLSTAEWMTRRNEQTAAAHAAKLAARRGQA